MPEITDLLPLATLLLVIGAFAGVIAGMLGVGGGIVLVPAFYHAFSTLGYGGPELMRTCLATSLATIIVTSLRSVAFHNRRGAVDWHILKSWSPGIVIGAILGMLAVASLRSAVLQGIFGCVGVVIGLYLGFGGSHWRIASGMPRGATRAVLTAVMGFLSVLMGIGGGSFGVPVMTLCGQPIHRAVGTAAGFGAVIAAPSVAGFLFHHPESAPPFTVGVVNIPAFVLIVAMTTITAPYGARLAHAMNPKPLRRIFAIFLIVVALDMSRKALGW